MIPTKMLPLASWAIILMDMFTPLLMGSTPYIDAQNIVCYNPDRDDSFLWA